jgi:hypothetical protein
MRRFGAIFSPIGLILADFYSKWVFSLIFLPKYQNDDKLLNLSPNRLIFSHNVHLALGPGCSIKNVGEQISKNLKMHFSLFF